MFRSLGPNLMLRVSTCVVFLTLSGTAAVQACPSFGFETDYLSDFFCRQLDGIAGPTTRTMGAGDPPAAPLGVERPTPEWLDLPAVSEAWRVDPAATLELIERIRAAGGRAQN